MNILFVTSWYPSKLDPTNGNFVERHALALISQGHQVRIVHEAFSNRILFPTIEVETAVSGIVIYQLYLPKILQGKLRVRKALTRRLLERLNIDEFNADIVHGHVLYPVGPVAVFTAKNLNVPLVFTEHWSGFLPENAHKLAPAKILTTQSVVSLCACVMPVSIALQSGMKDLGFHGNYEVIYNAVDTTLYFPVQEKPKKSFTFLHVSNFAPVKNVEGIIRAFAAFQQRNPTRIVELQVVGDGDLEALKSFTRREFSALKNVVFMGAQPYAGIARLMQQADCFVLFSEFETFGCVVAEALCVGLPVISTKVGAIPEMLDDSNGILINKSETGLLNAMNEMVMKSIGWDRNNTSQNAQKNFGYESIANQFAAIYSSARQHFDISE